MTTNPNLHHELLTDFLMWRATFENYRRLWQLQMLTDDEFSARLYNMGFRSYEIKAEMCDMRARALPQVAAPIAVDQGFASDARTDGEFASPDFTDALEKQLAETYNYIEGDEKTT